MRNHQPTYRYLLLLRHNIIVVTVDPSRVLRCRQSKSYQYHNITMYICIILILQLLLYILHWLLAMPKFLVGETWILDRSDCRTFGVEIVKYIIAKLVIHCILVRLKFANSIVNRDLKGSIRLYSLFSGLFHTILLSFWSKIFD